MSESVYMNIFDWSRNKEEFIKTVNYVSDILDTVEVSFYNDDYWETVDEHFGTFIKKSIMSEIIRPNESCFVFCNYNSAMENEILSLFLQYAKLLAEKLPWLFIKITSNLEENTIYTICSDFGCVKSEYLDENYKKMQEENKKLIAQFEIINGKKEIEKIKEKIKQNEEYLKVK